MIVVMTNEMKRLVAQALVMNAGISLVGRSDSYTEHALGVLRRTAAYRHLLQYLLTACDTNTEAVYFEEDELFTIRQSVSAVLARIRGAHGSEGFVHKVSIGDCRLRQVAGLSSETAALSPGHEIQVAAMAISFLVGDRCFVASDFSEDGGIEEACEATLLASQLYGLADNLHRKRSPDEKVNVSIEDLNAIRDGATEMRRWTETAYHREFAINAKGLDELTKLLLK